MNFTNGLLKCFRARGGGHPLELGDSIVTTVSVCTFDNPREKSLNDGWEKGWRMEAEGRKWWLLAARSPFT
jgi:hypothetical protein